MPLECSCSLVWLWELAESGEVVEGAQCDGQPLTQVRLKCDCEIFANLCLQL